MRFSSVDAIAIERQIINNRKEYEGAKIFSRIINHMFNPRNPKHTFSFFVPSYIYMRAISFCEEVEEEIGESFTIGHLANVLYIDFLEYVRKSNNIHDIYSRLKARGIMATVIKPYQTEKVYAGVLYEESRGYDEVKTRIDHRDALRGEYLLKDMLEIYQDHGFILEHILEVVFCDFIDDYRKSLIKNPIDKVIQYI